MTLEHALRGRTRYPGLVNTKIGTISPASFSDLYCWWKTDAITGLSNDDPISSVPDSSGNSRTAIQGTAAYQPLYKTNVLNGKPVMQFDNSNDGLGSTAAPSNPLSIMIVYCPFQYGGWHRAIQGQSTNWLIGPYDGKHRYYNGNWLIGPTATANVWVYVTITQSGSSNIFYVNGGLIGSIGGSTTPGNIYIGGLGAYTEPLNGQIAEVIVYSKVLPSDERLLLDTYIKNKYSL